MGAFHAGYGALPQFRKRGRLGFRTQRRSRRSDGCLAGQRQGEGLFNRELRFCRTGGDRCRPWGRRRHEPRRWRSRRTPGRRHPWCLVQRRQSLRRDRNKPNPARFQFLQMLNRGVEQSMVSAGHQSNRIPDAAERTENLGTIGRGAIPGDGMGAQPSGCRNVGYACGTCRYQRPA